jgi:hypothetical protein
MDLPPHEQRVKVFLLPGIYTPKYKNSTKIDFLGSKRCMDVKYANP